MLDFLNEDIFNVGCDLIIIPISTIGSVSTPFLSGLNKNGLLPEVYRKNYNLGDVEIHAILEAHNFKYVAFACAVDDVSSNYNAIRDIGINLARIVQSIDEIKIIATPILGTGAGGLNYLQSRNILFNAFYEIAKGSLELIFCTPDPKVFHSFENLVLDTESLSAQLVLTADRSRLLSSRYTEPIAFSSGQYYALAQEKFNEFINFKQDPIFFDNILDRFRLANTTYRNFLTNSDISSKDYDFIVLCGELIAYIDYNAYNKKTWNRNSDLRVLAKSGVNQTIWFVNLLRIKIAGSIDEISAASIKNALYYLANPSENTTMLSVRHRELVFQNLMVDQYEGSQSLPKLFYFFRKAGFAAVNPENDGALIGRILYLPEVKKMWLKEEETDEESDLLTDSEYAELSIANTLIEYCLNKKTRSLDLGNCGLRDLLSVPELFECTQLEELILSNEWAVYKEGIWRRQTSQNNGKPNVLSSLPAEFGKLINLKFLICGGDWDSGDGNWARWGIKSINAIARLSGLEYLNLSNNRIEDPSPLADLSQLRFLHLNNNLIDRPLPLTKLTNLYELNLSNNRLSDITFLEAAYRLDTLDLHANRITDISPLENQIRNIGVKNSKWEVGTINIAKNPLELPPMEIVILGRDAVLSNLADIRERGEFVNTDIKVILIGNSGAGKSTLVKYLDNENGLFESHPPTHWMVEKEVLSKFPVSRIGKKCLLRLLDFGGHDYYHDTHQVFFTNNTLYLLLWEEATDDLRVRKTVQADKNMQTTKVETQDYPVDYWLKSVEFFSKDVGASNFDFPVPKEDVMHTSLLMIQNKVANHSLILQRNNEKLHATFPFIFDFLNISIVNPARNMGHFDNIFQEMLDSMAIIGARLPKFYGTIKDEIKNYKGNPVLSNHQFLAFCNKKLAKPINIAQSDYLAQYLAQIGVLLCSRGQTAQKIYINKSWIIEKVHQVLNSLIESKGEFKFSEVCKVTATEVEANDVIAFMLDFKMIVKYPKKELYLAPLYLPSMPEASVNLFIDKSRPPYRRFEYKGFIHKNVILSFFSKYGELLKDDPDGKNYYYWKDALILKNSAEEIVMIKFAVGTIQGKAHIDIFNLGHSHSVAFATDIVKYIIEINAGYDIEEMVSLDGKVFVSMDILRENAEKGILVFSEKRMSDRALPKIKKEELVKLKDYEEFLPVAIKKKRVVISYSKADLAHVTELIRYLEPLVANGLIEKPWYCTDLNPGDNWETKLEEEFNRADIVFFMVSPDFYDTSYIVKKEIPNVINRYNLKKNVKPIPIILYPYVWERSGTYNLQNFNALPYQAKAITEFKNPRIAWNTITLSVQIMIEKELNPEKSDFVTRKLQTIFERQVAGKLDDNY